MPILKKGDTAPDIENAFLVYPDEVSESFSLSRELEAGTNILLAFHRYATCPICNFSLRQFQKEYLDLLALGIKYIPVFHSSVESMRASYPEKPPFDIIADPDMTLYKRYGLKPSITAFLHPKALIDGVKAVNSMLQPGYEFRFAPDNTLLTKPADFLIKENGEIAFIHYGKSLGDSITVDEAKALNALI